MKYMRIGISILGMCVNINFAANEVIHLIASKGVVPYVFIRESQTQSSQALEKNARERKIRSSDSFSLESLSKVGRDTLMEPVVEGVIPFEDSAKYLDAAFLQNAERIVSPLESPNGFFPISIVRTPVADRDEEEIGAESLIERSIPLRSYCFLPCSVSPSTEDDLFNSDDPWVRIETPQSQCSEGLFPTVIVPRPSATVTCTRTNVVTEVQFGSLRSSALGHGNTIVATKPVGPAPATPINTVSDH